MAKRLKTSRQKDKVNDAKENQKFLLIVALATIVLVVLMYLIFK
ncbi:MAG: hypothetical protein ACK4NS_09630 [Saprospiraceae bacterium]